MNSNPAANQELPYAAWPTPRDEKVGNLRKEIRMESLNCREAFGIHPDQMVEGRTTRDVDVDCEGVPLRILYGSNFITAIDLRDAYRAGRSLSIIEIKLKGKGNRQEQLFRDISPLLRVMVDSPPGAGRMSTDERRIIAEHFGPDIRIRSTVIDAANVFPAPDNLPPRLAAWPKMWDRTTLVRALANRQVFGCWNVYAKPGGVPSNSTLDDEPFDSVKLAREIVEKSFLAVTCEAVDEVDSFVFLTLGKSVFIFKFNLNGGL